MGGLTVKLILDGTMAALLLLTILYCRQLNRRIKVLQDSKSELAQLIRHFDESTERASSSIVALQSASKKIGETIQTRIEKANYLVDDLSFMIDKGSKLADVMEADLSAHRRKERGHDVPANTAEQRRAMEARGGQPSVKERNMASLENVLDRVSSRTGAAEGAKLSKPTAQISARLRSKAEQELLEAIKSKV